MSWRAYRCRCGGYRSPFKRLMRTVPRPLGRSVVAGRRCALRECQKVMSLPASVGITRGVSMWSRTTTCSLGKSRAIRYAMRTIGALGGNRTRNTNFGGSRDRSVSLRVLRVLSAPTRTRTWNSTFVASRDIRFTIGTFSVLGAVKRDRTSVSALPKRCLVT